STGRDGGDDVKIVVLVRRRRESPEVGAHAEGTLLVGRCDAAALAAARKLAQAGPGAQITAIAAGTPAREGGGLRGAAGGARGARGRRLPRRGARARPGDEKGGLRPDSRRRSHRGGIAGRSRSGGGRNARRSASHRGDRRRSRGRGGAQSDPARYGGFAHAP